MGSLPIPYLGMRVGSMKGGSEGWKEVVEKVKKKLGSWDVTKLSMRGKITLVNSVLSVVPLYNLSFMPIPVMVAKEITSLQCKFSWGGDGDSKKTAWIKWKDLCKHKKEGGLGLKNVQLFNKALLCKWIWRFLQEDEVLWRKVQNGKAEVRLEIEGKKGKS